MQNHHAVERISPAVFWREAARRLRFVDHDMPITEDQVDEVFLGLRQRHEMNVSPGSASTLTQFLVLFDEDLYRLLLAFAERELDDDQVHLVHELGEAFPGIYSMVEQMTSLPMIADDPPREEIIDYLRHGPIDIAGDDSLADDEPLV